MSRSVDYKPTSSSGRGIAQGTEGNSRSSERRLSVPGGERKRSSTQITSPSFGERKSDTGGRGASDRSPNTEYVVRSRDNPARGSVRPTAPRGHFERAWQEKDREESTSDSSRVTHSSKRGKSMYRNRYACVPSDDDGKLMLCSPTRFTILVLAQRNWVAFTLARCKGYTHCSGCDVF